jgi:hypothetical protein
MDPPASLLTSVPKTMVSSKGGPMDYFNQQLADERVRDLRADAERLRWTRRTSGRRGLFRRR